MVFEATRVLPLLGEPTPAMVEIFTKQLGWELRDSSRPVVNLWSTFIISEKGEHHVYSIGGVMLMGVGAQLVRARTVWSTSHRAGGSAR